MRCGAKVVSTLDHKLHTRLISDGWNEDRRILNNAPTGTKSAFCHSYVHIFCTPLSPAVASLLYATVYGARSTGSKDVWVPRTHSPTLLVGLVVALATKLTSKLQTKRSTTFLNQVCKSWFYDINTIRFANMMPTHHLGLKYLNFGQTVFIAVIMWFSKPNFVLIGGELIMTVLIFPI